MPRPGRTLPFDSPNALPQPLSLLFAHCNRRLLKDMQLSTWRLRDMHLRQSPGVDAISIWLIVFGYAGLRPSHEHGGSLVPVEGLEVWVKL